MKKFVENSNAVVIKGQAPVPADLEIGQEYDVVSTGNVEQRSAPMSEEHQQQNPGKTEWDLRFVEVRHEKLGRTFLASYPTEVESGTSLRVLIDTYISKKNKAIKTALVVSAE